MVASSMPAHATEIFQEGLILPPLRLYERGVVNETPDGRIGLGPANRGGVLGVPQVLNQSTQGLVQSPTLRPSHLGQHSLLNPKNCLVCVLYPGAAPFR